MAVTAESITAAVPAVERTAPDLTVEQGRVVALLLGLTAQALRRR